MDTERIIVDPLHPDPEVIARAARIIRAGGLVAFPTETVYGLGANGLSSEAIHSIFTAKGRPSHNPIILGIAHPEQVDALAVDIPRSAKALMDRFWPGPLTLVMRRSSLVPDAVTAGGETVGVRMPAHEVARCLINAAGVPIAVPSANRSGAISPTTGDHVAEELTGHVDMILDAGPTGVGIESTILDVTEWPPRILRLGGVTIEQLTDVIGISPTRGNRTDLPRYRGGFELILVPGEREARVQALWTECARQMSLGRAVTVVSTDETAEAASPPAGVRLVPMGPESDTARIASQLFGLLRELNYAADVLIIEGISPEGLGRTIMDRLRGAATRTIGEENAPRLLIVCTGNTCRSAMAEALIREAAGTRGLRLEVRSAGIAAADSPASPRAIEALAEKRIDLTGHRARAVTREMIDWADVILVMTTRHREAIISLDPVAAEKTHLIREFAGTAGDVHDPYGGELVDYQETRDDLEHLAHRIVEKIVSRPCP